MSELVNQYFGFLTNIGFNGPFEVNYAYEKHIYYVKRTIIIDIAFDAYFWVDVIRIKNVIPELESGVLTLSDIDPRKHCSYQLSQLDPEKEVFNSISSKSESEKELQYNAVLLQNNLEILEGDLRKFNFFNKTWRRFKFIKKH